MQYYILIVCIFLLALRFPPHNKIESHDIAEILLKVALNTITLTHFRTTNICFRTSTIWERTARSYAYGSGIYLYICSHCHSLFMLWVRFSYMVRCTRYILYYEAIPITVVLELLPLFWYVAHEKRENHLNSELILFRLIMMLNSELHQYQVGGFLLYQSCLRPSKLTVAI